MKFFMCDYCGKVILLIDERSTTTFCCGSEMRELIPQNIDLKKESHLPVVSIDEYIVDIFVGKKAHPMDDYHHYIMWIVLETNLGFQLHYLTPEEDPFTRFIIDNDEIVVAVYAYCNIHGLWKKEL